jgi:hypothetical protein
MISSLEAPDKSGLLRRMDDRRGTIDDKKQKKKGRKNIKSQENKGF